MRLLPPLLLLLLLLLLLGVATSSFRMQMIEIDDASFSSTRCSKLSLSSARDLWSSSDDSDAMHHFVVHYGQPQLGESLSRINVQLCLAEGGSKSWHPALLAHKDHAPSLSTWQQSLHCHFQKESDQNRNDDDRNENVCCAIELDVADYAGKWVLGVGDLDDDKGYVSSSSAIVGAIFGRVFGDSDERRYCIHVDVTPRSASENWISALSALLCALAVLPLTAALFMLAQRRRGVVQPTEANTNTSMNTNTRASKPLRPPSFLSNSAQVSNGGDEDATSVAASSSSSSSSWPRTKKKASPVTQLDANEVKLGKKVGNGSFGTVHRGQWRARVVAVKRINLGKRAIDRFDECMREASLLATLRHDNIIEFVGYALRLADNEMWLLTEYCDRGNVRDYMRSLDGARPSDVRVLCMCREVAAGMLYLHTRRPRIVHRDLKCQSM
jgi:Protein tyrosine and serine/threonine kinase